jgi:hypothetical protein
MTVSKPTASPPESNLPTKDQLQEEINQALQAIAPAKNTSSPSGSEPNSNPTSNIQSPKISSPSSQTTLSATSLQAIYEDPKLPKKVKPKKSNPITPLVKYSLIAVILFGVGLVAGLAVQLLLSSIS